MDIKTEYGTMRMLPGPVARAFGAWAGHEAAFVAANLPDGARIADIGSGTGAFGLGLMAHRTLGLVCFAETDCHAHAALADNVGRLARAHAVVVTEPLSPGALIATHGPFDLVKLRASDVAALGPHDLRTAGPCLWLECDERAVSARACETLLAAGFVLSWAGFPAHTPEQADAATGRFGSWAYDAALWATRGAPPALPEALRDAGCVLRPIRTPQDFAQAFVDTPRRAPASWGAPDAPDAPDPVAHAARIMLDAERRWSAATFAALRADNETKDGRIADGAAQAADLIERLDLTVRARVRAEALAAEQACLLADQGAALVSAETRLREQAPEIERLARWDASAMARIAIRMGRVADAHPRAFRLARAVAARAWRLRC